MAAAQYYDTSLATEAPPPVQYPYTVVHPEEKISFNANETIKDSKPLEKKPKNNRWKLCCLICCGFSLILTAILVPVIIYVAVPAFAQVRIEAQPLSLTRGFLARRGWLKDDV